MNGLEEPSCLAGGCEASQLAGQRQQQRAQPVLVALAPFEIFEDVKEDPDDAEKDVLFAWLLQRLRGIEVHQQLVGVRMRDIPDPLKRRQVRDPT